MSVLGGYEKREVVLGTRTHTKKKSDSFFFESQFFFARSSALLTSTRPSRGRHQSTLRTFVRHLCPKTACIGPNLFSGVVKGVRGVSGRCLVGETFDFAFGLL